jgi:ABC-type nitrate/sulfonate/bicarbonate transport system substrate-binding protein
MKSSIFLRFNRFRSAATVLIAIAMLLALACGQRNESQTGTDTTATKPKSAQVGDGIYHGKIKAGHLVALDMAPLFVAKEAGFFKEEGLDLETVFFANPGDNNAALAGGSIQFSTNPFTLPYFAENSGVPMRIVSSAGGLGIMQVVVQGSYGISNMEDLAKWVKAHPNKKLKVATLKGDTLEMILYREFQRVGLSYDNFEMIWFNDLLAMVQSFETKQTDILSHIQPYTVGFQAHNGAKLLTDNSRAWGEGTPNCTVSVMDDFANKYPKTVEGYLAALHRGFQLIVDDPVRARDLLVKGNYYRVDPEVLLTALKGQKKVVLRPNVDGMMICIRDMVAAGYIKQPKQNIVRLEFLDRVEKRLAANR